jgi:hypothetical protein
MRNPDSQIKATTLRNIIQDLKDLRELGDARDKQDYAQIIGTLTMRLLEYDDEVKEPPLRKA